MQLIEPHSNEEFTAYYACRWRTLRAPWSQPPGSERAATDPESFHVMAMENNEVLGVASMHPAGEARFQVRFMGVEASARKKGVGQTMLAYLEQLAKKNEGKEIVLQAREIAIPFYEKNGYRIEKKSHLLWGEIQHFTMVKSIA